MGLVTLTLVAGIGMGPLASGYISVTWPLVTVLAMSLAFWTPAVLNFFTAYASQATALLFGNILGVDAGNRMDTVTARRRRLQIGLVGAVAAAIVRQPATGTGGEGCIASSCIGAVPGHRRRRRGGSAQIVGVGVRTDGGALAGRGVTARFWSGIALSVVLALGEAWLGLALACRTDRLHQLLDYHAECGVHFLGCGADWWIAA